MKKIIAGVMFFVMAAAAWATTYTFSGSSFPTCSSGSWSGSGTSANPYTCGGSFTLQDGDSISPSSLVYINSNVYTADNMSNGASLSKVAITGNFSNGNGNMILNLASTASINGNVSSVGSLQITGGSISGNVSSNGGNGLVIQGGAVISGNATSSGSLTISGSGTTVAGNVQSNGGNGITISSSATVNGNITGNSTAVNISGSTVAGNITSSGGNGVTITNSTMTSGNVSTTNSTQVTISGSTLGSPSSSVNVNVNGSQNVTVSNGSTIYGTVVGSGTVTVTGSTVYGSCTQNNGGTTSTTTPGGTFNNNCVGSSSSPPSAFNAFESSTTSGAITGVIYTKLAGTAFSLDLVAVASSQPVKFSGNVSVSLVAAPTGTNASSAGGGVDCTGTYTTVVAAASTPSALFANAGRVTYAFPAISTAYRDVRVLIQSSSPALKVCSADNFAIRPGTFSVTSTGTGLTASNTATTGTPTFKAGSGVFNLTATTTSGYDGTPSISSVAGALTGSSTAGSIGGSFGAASAGVASGNAFTYSEVGNFSLSANSVYDQNFTAVDQKANAECTSNYSTSLSGGMYGCYIGSAAAGAFGRFIPDHFSVAVTAACTSGTAYTYSGQPLNLVTVTAMSGLSPATTTQNYTYNSSSSALTFAKQVTLTDVSGANGSWNSTNVIAASTFSSGIATTSTPTFTFSTIPLVPATLQVRAAENSSSGTPAGDGVSSFVSSSVNYDGSALIRQGRLRMFNAYGAVGTTLSMPMQTQYWSKDSVWVLNSDDSCTTVGTANVYSTPSSTVLPQTIICPSTGNSATAFCGGQATLPLKSQGLALTQTTSVGVAINLGTGSADQSCLSSHGGSPASQPWLRSLNGNCATTYDRDPAATATFGIYTPESKYMIHMREAYW